MQCCPNKWTPQRLGAQQQSMPSSKMRTLMGSPVQTSLPFNFHHPTQTYTHTHTLHPPFTHTKPPSPQKHTFWVHRYVSSVAWLGSVSATSTTSCTTAAHTLRPDGSSGTNACEPPAGPPVSSSLGRVLEWAARVVAVRAR
eukprot:1138621-Pelagomonas_calceolata.AAC.2